MNKAFYDRKFEKDTKNLAVAYYRLPEDLKTFIDRLPEVYAIEIDGWNIGFAVDYGDAKKKSAMEKLSGKEMVYLVPEEEQNANNN